MRECGPDRHSRVEAPLVRSEVGATASTSRVAPSRATLRLFAGLNEARGHYRRRSDDARYLLEVPTFYIPSRFISNSIGYEYVGTLYLPATD